MNTRVATVTFGYDDRDRLISEVRVSSPSQTSDYTWYYSYDGLGNRTTKRDADAAYRLILADLHVARAELAKLAGDEKAMRDECSKAIAICDARDCGYAWAKQDAQGLLDQ